MCIISCVCQLHYKEYDDDDDDDDVPLSCRKNDRPTFAQIDKQLSRITYVDDTDVEMTSDPPPDVLNVDDTHLKLMA